MLLEHIDDNEGHLFGGDTRDGFLYVFLTREMFERGGHVKPLWYQEVKDERSYQAFGRWLGVRRDKWAGWGRLAEAVGHEAFDRHMRKLLEESPVAEVVGTIVQRQEDPVEVAFGEMLANADGTFFEELYRHRFENAAARERFYDWFHTDSNVEQAGNLLRIGYLLGTDALGRTLDELVDPATTSAAKPTAGRRKGRSHEVVA